MHNHQKHRETSKCNVFSSISSGAPSACLGRLGALPSSRLAQPPTHRHCTPTATSADSPSLSSHRTRPRRLLFRRVWTTQNGVCEAHNAPEGCFCGSERPTKLLRRFWAAQKAVSGVSAVLNCPQSCFGGSEPQRMLFWRFWMAQKAV